MICSGEMMRARLEMLRQIAREYPNTEQGKWAARELQELEAFMRAPTAIALEPVHA